MRHRSSEKRTSSVARLVVIGLLVAVAIAVMATPASASHFRYGHLTWKPRPDLGANTAEFTLTDAFRRDGYAGTAGDGFPALNDVITENIGGTFLDFGDANVTGTLDYKVTAIDPIKNWLVAVALDPNTATPNVIHQYASATNGGAPWIAEINSSARIGALQNCANCPYRVLTQVRFDIVNSSPVSSLTPIVNVPVNTIYSYFVPAGDANGDALSWRFSTSAESNISDEIGPGGGADAPFAPTIVAGTGQLTWNTNGTAVGQLYTLQVTIDETRGVNIGSSAVDYIMEIVDSVGTPPSCQIAPSGPFNVNVGGNVSFTITGTDVDPLDVLTINTGGLPSGATMTPPLPTSGPTGVSSTFNWTPFSPGTYVIAYTVTDNGGQQSQCNVTINVSAGPIPTLSEWGMIIFVVLLAGWMTFVVVRRWRRSHATLA